ncbi:MAG: PASTA domain-containing protein [bacterium JZ-2024 1]
MPDLDPDLITLNRPLGHRGVIQIFEGHYADRAVLLLGDETAKILPIIAKSRVLVNDCQTFDHPNYLPFLGVIQKQNMTLFVHDGTPARPLAAVLRDQPILALDQALMWFLEMVSVLDYLHKKGIVHGFLSPSSFAVNLSEFGGPTSRAVLLFDYPGEALVKRATCFESRVLPFSSMAYSAPEVVRGETMNPGSDYFSLGALLARMVTGRYPFGDSFGRPDERVLLSDVPPDLNLDIALPPSLIRLLERLLDRNPATRLANADEVRGWVQAIIAEHTHNTKRRQSPLRSALKSLLSLAYGTAVFVGVLTLIAGAYVIYNTFFRSDSYVTVPNLVGKHFEDAKPQAASYRLRLEKAGQEFSAAYSDNTIIRQEPEPGTRTKSSSVIKVVVSRGPLIVRVPDLKGLTVPEARKRLEEAKLALGIENNEDAPPPAGSIVRQSPEPGTEVVSGERVHIWVSTGQGTAWVTMPDLTGFSIGSVLEALIPLGLDLAEIHWKHRADINSELVVSQVPEPDTEVAGGSRVTLEAVRPERNRGKATISLYVPPTKNPVRLTIRVDDSRGPRTLEFSFKGGILNQEIDFLGSATVEVIAGDRVIRRERFD